MITLRRAEQRHHDHHLERDAWRTFYPGDCGDPFNDGYGSLESLAEIRLPPRAPIPRRDQRDSEIATYVREGALVYEDSMGCSDVIRAGEFQRISARYNAHHIHTNVSRTEWAQVYQIWLCPAGAVLEPSHEQRRFSVAERRGVLCVVASPDGRGGSLCIHQDTFIYSAILPPGLHVVHELQPGRAAWLHLVHGEVAFGDDGLSTGDGAGIMNERAVSLTARTQSEILLVNLRDELPIPAD